MANPRRRALLNYRVDGFHEQNEQLMPGRLRPAAAVRVRCDRVKSSSRTAGPPARDGNTQTYSASMLVKPVGQAAVAAGIRSLPTGTLERALEMRPRGLCSSAPLTMITARLRRE